MIASLLLESATLPYTLQGLSGEEKGQIASVPDWFLPKGSIIPIRRKRVVARGSFRCSPQDYPVTYLLVMTRLEKTRHSLHGIKVCVMGLFHKAHDVVEWDKLVCFWVRRCWCVVCVSFGFRRHGAMMSRRTKVPERTSAAQRDRLRLSSSERITISTPLRLPVFVFENHRCTISVRKASAT